MTVAVVQVHLEIFYSLSAMPLNFAREPTAYLFNCSVLLKSGVEDLKIEVDTVEPSNEFLELFIRIDSPSFP